MFRTTLKKSLFSTLSLFTIMNNVQALENELPIWPSKAPGSESLNLVDSIVNRTLTGTCTIDRAISKIGTPTITPFVPDKPNGTSVIICPGGGYVRVVYDVEGADIAKMFNEIGITVFVLKYRLPGEGHVNRKYVTLQDAQRAVRYVKKNAGQWHLDTSKVGIMGCSAGGHAAASLTTGWDKNVYTAIDAADAISAHPAFSIFLYPVISMDPSITHAGTSAALFGTSSPSPADINEFSTEKHVQPLTPPAFIAVAADDSSVKPENSKRYIDSLNARGITNTYKIYKDGGHGKGICKAVGTDFINWVTDCNAWLDQMKLISPSAVTHSDVNRKNPDHEVFHQKNDLLIRSASGNVITVVQIFDLTGKIIKDYVYNEKSVTIDVSSLSSGSYYVKSYSNSTVEMNLFVIK